MCSMNNIIDVDKLFILEKSKTSRNGSKTYYYKPNSDYDIYIKSMNLETGDVDYKKIKWLTKHFNLRMYLIEYVGNDLSKKFKSIKVSDDHSLIVYDAIDDRFYKKSPLHLIKYKEKNSGRYYLVKIDKDNNKTLISLNDINITECSSDTIGYDFTVDDWYTFTTADGLLLQDTVAVFMPLTVESQRDIYEKMYRNYTAPATGGLTLEIRHNMIIGWYLATRTDNVKLRKSSKIPKNFTFESLYEFIKEDISRVYIVTEYSSQKTGYKKVKTTLGRILLNLILPDNIEFIDEKVTKKTAKKIMNMLKTLDSDKLTVVVKRLEDVGFELATLFSFSLNIDELILPAEFKKKVEKLKEIRDPVKGMKYLDELKAEMIEYIRDHYPTLFVIFDSGARGSWNDLVQMILAKGYVNDAEGKVIKIPVAKGFVDNLTADEYFKITSMGRYGIISRSINTDKPGYLTRKLVFASATVYLGNTSDCMSNKGIKFEVNDEKDAQAIIGRYTVDGKYINDENYKSFIGKTVVLRSPIYCRSDKICKKCYGNLYKIVNTDKIGELAAQSIGERGTQLIMKVHHTGQATISGTPNVVTDEFKDYLYQEETEVYAKRNCKIIIDKDNSEFRLFEDHMVFMNGIIVIEFNDDIVYELEISSTEPFALNIPLEDYKTTEHEIIIKCVSDSLLFTIDLQSQDTLVAINTVQRMFEARGEYSNMSPDELLKSIYGIYKDYGIKLVHFEIILSNMFRCANDMSKPLRLCPNMDNYKVIGISNIPFYESPLLAMSFQHISKSIYYGLISDKDRGNSTFEKIVLGEF